MPDLSSPLEALSRSMLPALDAELRQAVARVNGAGLSELNDMLAYHMGWSSGGQNGSTSGKRIRPLLLLLTCGAAGGDWQAALPAAAAIELIHNFSLIHDDIQDHSELRRGRPTVWALWGAPQAINAGDAMFTLAHLAMLRTQETLSAEVALHAAGLLERACLELTQGQYLDISYEQRTDLSIEDYWPMVSGKTAALLSACTKIGALAAGADIAVQESYRRFGYNLGLAFQTQDDILGIWGEAAQTGKSTESDLVSGKKSLPVLYGLSRDGAFAARWRQGAIQPDEVRALARQLEAEGVLEYTQAAVQKLTDQALNALVLASPAGDAGRALLEISQLLLNRKS